MFTDPIGDMISRIRNAQMRSKENVSIPFSRIKKAILDVMVREGYLSGYSVSGEGVHQNLVVDLKYFNGRPVIRAMKRVSKPSVQMYTSAKKMVSVANGLGTAVLTTSRGILSDREAKMQHVGGKILFTVC